MASNLDVSKTRSVEKVSGVLELFEFSYCSYKLWPVWRITSGAIQYGVPFMDLAPETVA